MVKRRGVITNPTFKLLDDQPWHYCEENAGNIKWGEEYRYAKPLMSSEKQGLVCHTAKAARRCADSSSGEIYRTCNALYKTLLQTRKTMSE